MDKFGSDQIVMALLSYCEKSATSALCDIKKFTVTTNDVEWSKVEEEMIFFFYFCLDYWLWECQADENQKNEIQKTLRKHWEAMLGDEATGLLLQKRLHQYSCVVNEQIPDKDLFLKLGNEFRKLAGLKSNPFLLIITTDIFTGVMGIVYDVVRLHRE